MKRIIWIAGAFALLISFSAHSAAVRVSGDNAWQVFHNGEMIAQGDNWQVPTVTEFQLDNRGYALIAIYVHDAEPGDAGKGGFLADIILDDGEYLSTNADDPRWKCDSGDVIASRDDGWETAGFDDSEWMELTYYEQFGGGIWGFGADAMRNHLNDPDCEAYWAWCGPNDGADDVYFRYVIGELDVKPAGRLAASWGEIKQGR